MIRIKGRSLDYLLNSRGAGSSPAHDKALVSYRCLDAFIFSFSMSHLVNTEYYFILKKLKEALGHALLARSSLSSLALPSPKSA